MGNEFQVLKLLSFTTGVVINTGTHTRLHFGTRTPALHASPRGVWVSRTKHPFSVHRPANHPRAGAKLWDPLLKKSLEKEKNHALNRGSKG